MLPLRALAIFTFSIIALFPACNLFEDYDVPRTNNDLFVAAQAYADQGDCLTARDLLRKIGKPGDHVLLSLGWAHMCLAGATASTIAGTIYTYSSSGSGASDLTVVGQLARSMVPMTGDKLSNLDSAINTFAAIKNPKIAALETAIAKLVKAAALIAKQAPNAGSTIQLTRLDVDANCSTACVLCNTAPQMDSTDITNFVSTISEAALGLGNAAAANLSTLAGSISNGIQGGTDAARCFIYGRVIPAI